MAGRRSDEEARETRDAILRRAVDVASVDGFEGLTFGSLAKDRDMSKAGILGHFPTKEQLQLAVYAEAARVFRELVVEPGRDARGIERLRGYAQRWTQFVSDPPWPGGCILTAASFEFDDRPGAMRDEIHRGAVWWRRRLREAAQEAIDDGDLPTGFDPDQIAFTIVALATGTVRVRQTHRDPEAGTRLQHAYDALLGVAA